MEENPSGLYCAEVKNYFSISAIARSEYPGSHDQFPEEMLLFHEVHNWLILKGHLVTLFKKEWDH